MVSGSNCELQGAFVFHFSAVDCKGGAFAHNSGVFSLLQAVPYPTFIRYYN
jgi:hypothetical protein